MVAKIRVDQLKFLQKKNHSMKLKEIAQSLKKINEKSFPVLQEN